MASSSSTPASSSQKWTYDVFLSFRGEDTRKTFIDHLYSALKQKGIYTYKDDETLKRGESIAPSLLKAIRESRIAVIVLSENYADSSWCLDELRYIMKCMDEIGQIVLPIFYHVEPSHVRKQEGEFGKGFAKHDSAGNTNKVESWRNALVAAANLSGWETKHIANGHEARCINEIVNTISERLPSIISNIDEEFIGLRTRIQQLKSELEIGSGGVRMVGIWGLGGGGKTTLASCVYDEIYSLFDKCYFLENIRENSSNNNGLKSLQQRIVEEVRVGRVEEGKRMIKRRLSHTSVLIVLDDVDDVVQLDALAGSHDWFGEGSRILITTRDNHVLKAHKVDVINNICLLNNDEAIKLFCKHAPQGKLRLEDYEHFSKTLVRYASGLPLALKVLGRFLCDKDMNEWRSALARLKEIPDNNIVEKLKISFDGLTTVEKDLFLDIACLYRGHHDVDAMAMLEACGFHPVIGVKVLIQKALITVDSHKKFDMHDLIQEMGLYIVRGEAPKNPEKHSRVWKGKDVRRICATDTKMELDKIEAIRYKHKDALPSHVDASMTNLRSVDLIYLCGSSLPTYLLTTELRCLNLCLCQHRQLWEGYKVLPNLRYIKIRFMNNLIRIPDVSGLINVERFEIYSCDRLEEIHSSLGCSESLVCLKIKNCKNLVIVPPITGSKKLESLSFEHNRKLFEVPETPEIHVDEIEREEVASDKHSRIKRFVSYLRCCCSNLNEPNKAEFDVQFSLGEPSLRHNISYISSHKSLTNLYLNNCELGDDDFGSFVGELPTLQKLDVSGNDITHLDFSLLELPRLKWVSYCSNLVELLELPSSIAVLEADYCRSLESIRDISNCKWLWKVSLVLRVSSTVLKMPDFISEGNAIEDHFISLAFPPYQLQMEFVDWVSTRGEFFTLQLPPNWYDDSCGFFICIDSFRFVPQFTIILNPEMGKDFQFEDGQESNVAWRPNSCSNTYVGYVSLNMLKRHTKATWWNLAYNTTSFSILVDDDGYDDDTAFGAKLVLRKSKGHAVQTAKGASDYSEFWDEEYEDQKTFTIQHDSNSSIKIVWTPHGPPKQA